MLIIMFIAAIAYMAVLYKLITTNHWTIGKKLLVCLVAAIIIEAIGKIAAMIFVVPAAIAMITQMPFVVVGLLMTYFFYRKEDVLG